MNISRMDELRANKILSIATATKRIGLAVLSRKELVYFAVKTLTSPRTSERIGKQTAEIITKLLSEFDLERIVLKKLGKQQQRSRNSRMILATVARVARLNGIALDQADLDASKNRLCGSTKATKRQVFESLSIHYPELRCFVPDANRPQSEYYNSILSAVAIGHFLQNRNCEYFHSQDSVTAVQCFNDKLIEKCLTNRLENA